MLRVRSVAVPALALVVAAGLSGCGSDDTKAERKQPKPSASATVTTSEPAAYLEVPDGVTLTEPGTDLAAWYEDVRSGKIPAQRSGRPAGDPVQAGIVDSLARPGGNITGLSILAPEISGKQLDILRQIIPKLVRVGVFGNSNEPANAKTLEKRVYDVPTDIDKDVARLKLETMGIHIDELTESQKSYLAGWEEGT